MSTILIIFFSTALSPNYFESFNLVFKIYMELDLLHPLHLHLSITYNFLLYHPTSFMAFLFRSLHQHKFSLILLLKFISSFVLVIILIHLNIIILHSYSNLSSCPLHNTPIRTILQHIFIPAGLTT